MTAGAGSALNLIMKSLLDIDDEVVVPRPYFAEYKGYIENYYGKIAEADPRPDGSFLPDMEKIEKAITPRTKAVLINTPNNPTGVVYPEKVITELAELLRRKEKEIGHPIYLISDEPYREIVYGGGYKDDADDSGDALPWIPDYYDDTIVAYSYSKTLSLPGERIGNIIVPDTCDGADELIGALTAAMLVEGVVNAPSLMQLVIARCLDEKVNVDFYKENGELLYDIVTSAGFTAVKPQGAFYLWVSAPDGDDQKLVDLAKKHKILMVPGSAFAGPGCVRLSFCVARDMIERSRNAFMELGEEYK